jgi:hypothetical protein
MLSHGWFLYFFCSPIRAPNNVRITAPEIILSHFANGSASCLSFDYFLTIAVVLVIAWPRFTPCSVSNSPFFQLWFHKLSRLH